MFKQMTIKAQLRWLSGFFVAMLVISGALGLQFLTQTVGGLKTVYEDRVVPLKQLRTVADMYAVNIVDTVHKVRDGALTREQGLKSIAEARSSIQTQWSAYTATFLVARETELVAKGKPLFASADTAVAQAQALFESSDQAALTAFAAKDMYPLLDPLQGVISDLIQTQLDVAKDVHDEGLVTGQHALVMVVAFAALAALIGGLIAHLMTRRIVNALGAEPAELNRIVNGVAQGELFHTFALKDGDTTSVAASVNTMTSTLRQIVRDTRGNAESVACASIQISQGNLDLSGRTENQASALEETAASMEEISSIVSLNADNAAKANELAGEARELANQGVNAVKEVVDTMQRIDASSQQITSIIGVMDGIAFQTNILSLNAAVEAARAGEEGRGFAVVASEVRQLAQRSADAARQIKTLIADSSERIASGSALVDKAGNTMQQIVQANARVATLMSDISAASREQAAGVNQVSEAVMGIDEITQQNAALVEESAAAAQSLQEQAAALVNNVAVFRLTPDDAHTAAAPATPAAAKASTHAQQEMARPVATAPRTQPVLAHGERRGPNRATNVTRPKFGARDTKALKPLGTASQSASVKTSADKLATGTEGSWSSF